MHPGMYHWWKHARHAAHHGEHAAHDGAGFGGCGPRGGFGFAPGGVEWHASAQDDGELGGGFGVRRPLRFLAHKLDLDDKQVADLAQILDELKTERAQAAVDHRRTTSAIADAVAGETLDAEKVAAADRVKSAERVRDAVVKALGKIHALLDADQRQRLAYLLRTGALSM